MSRIILSALSALLSFLLAIAPAPGDEVRTPDLLLQRSWGRAAAWLHTQQRPDGSMGDAGSTALVAYDLALGGEDPTGLAWTVNGHSLLDGLAAETPAYVGSGDAGRIGRVLLAVIQAGADPRHFAGEDLVSRLEAAYNPATGLYHRYNNFGNAIAIEALVAAGRPVPRRAIEALIDQQRANGGWGWPVDGTAVDTDTTGLVMEALAQAGVSADLPAIKSAVTFLRQCQKADGGWGTFYVDWSNCNSTALAIRGLVAFHIDPEATVWQKEIDLGQALTPVRVLLHFQEGNGAYRYTDVSAGARLLATADALPALSADYPEPYPLPWKAYLPVVKR